MLDDHRDRLGVHRHLLSLLRADKLNLRLTGSTLTHNVSPPDGP